MRSALDRRLTVFVRRDYGVKSAVLGTYRNRDALTREGHGAQAGSLALLVAHAFDVDESPFGLIGESTLENPDSHVFCSTGYRRAE